MTVGDLDTLIPLRHDIDVLMPQGTVTLEGLLSVPSKAKGVVLFAHASGSGRLSPRNHAVAEELYKHGFATLLTDLLTQAEEEADAGKKQPLATDVDLLARRLSGIVKWICAHDKIGNKPLGLFCASEGAASALVVAAEQPEKVRAAVLRGNRPNLAAAALQKVETPALLIVGSNDREVLKQNEMALARLNNRCHLEVIAGASHEFQESGTLEEAARLAGAWFERYLH